MRRSVLVATIALLFIISTACTGSTPVETAATEAVQTASILPTIPASTYSATPNKFTATPTVTPSPTPPPTATLSPDAWQSLPVVPGVSDAARRIYGSGQKLGNDTHAFSILGDCLSFPINLFGNFGKGPNHYNLGEYTYLQPVIDWFKDSFNRQSITLGDGFNTAAVLSPLRNDPQQCQSDESPLVCEYRVHKPVFALISLGTDDNQTPPETYEKRMRQIVEYTISQGIIPILSTKADNREGDNAFNRIVAGLAYEYDVPLWNFWAAVQSLPQQGVANERGHLTWADPNRLDATYVLKVAVPVRTITGLRTLDAVWRGINAP